jgi:nitrite reductase (NADH) small subunit/3-phenylpropionate/trans-cinnamate dioxygenase ferredoxin subunit
VGEFVKVGRVGDFREGRGVAVRVGKKKVAVFKLDGKLYAIQDACPHMGASLADGKLDGCRVICHWHDWRFDLVTGQGDQRSKDWLRARVYAIELRGDEVWVEPPEEPRPSTPEDDDEWVAWDDRFLKKKD